MLNQHNQLLLTDEALETRIVLIIRISILDDRSRSRPSNILRLGKQIMHQLLLARQLNLHMSLSQPTTSPTSPIHLKAIDRIDSLIEADELHIAVQRLARNTLHDDVHGLEVLLVDDTGVTAEESEDFGTVD